MLSMFNSEFVSSVEDVLADRCANGQACSVKELCEALELDEKDVGGAVRCLVHNLSDYETKKGSGITLRGAERQPRPTEFAEGFVDSIRSALESLATAGRGVTRKAIAEAIGQPGSDTELNISKAYKAGHLEGWTVRKGPSGGFVRETETATAAE